jgi:predicted DNA-binding protein (MmcQ/YjbR family)
MFCLSSLKEWEKGIPSINLKCHPEKAIALRAEYEAVKPGYHMSKIHWNTIEFNSDVSDKMIVDSINHSYNLVFNSLTKKIQNEIINTW